MRTIGFVIVILGVLALIYGGLEHYNHDDTLLKIGSAEVMESNHRRLPVAALFGAIVLISGIALVMAGKRRGMRT